MNFKIRGFTLIELMIVVTILGILSGIAIPSYLEYLRDARRSEAQETLLQHAATLERQYTRLGGYPDAYVVTSSDYYTFTYTASAAAQASAANNDSSSFLLEAKPKTGSSQASDSCGTLTVNHQGTNTASGNSCWH